MCVRDPAKRAQLTFVLHEGKISEVNNGKDRMLDDAGLLLSRGI